MQSWGQWPAVPTATATPIPPPPTGYTATPGSDPMATMQAYMQYYSQPAPSGYTPEQWAAAQQQNWAQWQQWQQQYQQWQAQYGEKYQETMKQYGQTAPPLPSATQPPPPPPKDDKPPLPPTSTASYGYSTTAPPPPPATATAGVKRSADGDAGAESAKKMKETDEELSDAEKTFDAQFKQWEEKFNTWKLANANHPDKTQYKQYEAKWTSWREKLIERREQMRRKREQQKLAAAAKAESEKKDIGGDKIMNILSSTENQGLINNLLGIGKTLGLTTKSDQTTATSTTATSSAATTVPTQASIVAPPVAMTPMMQPDMTQAWAQWSQYTQSMAAAAMPYMPAMPMPTATPAVNFNQPPPGFPSVNLSQPPPGFTNTTTASTTSGDGKPPPLMPADFKISQKYLERHKYRASRYEADDWEQYRRERMRRNSQDRRDDGSMTSRSRRNSNCEDFDNFDNFSQHSRSNRRNLQDNDNCSNFGNNDNLNKDNIGGDDNDDGGSRRRANPMNKDDNNPDSTNNLNDKDGMDVPNLDSDKGPSKGDDNNMEKGPEGAENSENLDGPNRVDEMSNNRRNDDFKNQGNRDFNNQDDDNCNNRRNENVNRRGNDNFNDRNDDNFNNRRNDDNFNNRRNDDNFNNRRNDDNFNNRRNDDNFNNRRNDDNFNNRRNDDNFNNRRNDDNFNNRRNDNYDDRCNNFDDRNNRNRNRFDDRHEDGNRNFGRNRRDNDNRRDRDNDDFNDRRFGRGRFGRNRGNFDDSDDFGNNRRGRFRRFGSRNSLDDQDCNSRDRNDFNDDRNRGSNNFGNRNRDGNFRNRGNRDFDDDDNFRNRGRDRDNFRNRRNDDFDNDRSNNFRNRGPNNSRNRGNDDFDNDGPNNFGNRGSNNFRDRRCDDFGNDGPDDFRNRGPNNANDRGNDNYGNDGPDNFGNRGSNNSRNRKPDNFDTNSNDGFGNMQGPNFSRQNQSNFTEQGPSDQDMDSKPKNKRRGFSDFPPMPEGPENQEFPGNFQDMPNIPNLDPPILDNQKEPNSDAPQLGIAPEMNQQICENQTNPIPNLDAPCNPDINETGDSSMDPVTKVNDWISCSQNQNSEDQGSIKNLMGPNDNPPCKDGIENENQKIDNSAGIDMQPRNEQFGGPNHNHPPGRSDFDNRSNDNFQDRSQRGRFEPGDVNDDFRGPNFGRHDDDSQNQQSRGRFRGPNFNEDVHGRNEIQNRNDKFQNRNDEFNNRNDNFQNRNDEFNNRNDNFQNRNDEFNNRNDNFQNRNDNFQNRNDKFKNRNDDFQNRNDDFPNQRSRNKFGGPNFNDDGCDRMNNFDNRDGRNFQDQQPRNKFRGPNFNEDPCDGNNFDNRDGNNFRQQPWNRGNGPNFNDDFDNRRKFDDREGPNFQNEQPRNRFRGPNFNEDFSDQNNFQNRDNNEFPNRNRFRGPNFNEDSRDGMSHQNRDRDDFNNAPPGGSKGNFKNMPFNDSEFDQNPFQFGPNGPDQCRNQQAPGTVPKPGIPSLFDLKIAPPPLMSNSLCNPNDNVNSNASDRFAPNKPPFKDGPKGMKDKFNDRPEVDQLHPRSGFDELPPPWANAPPSLMGSGQAEDKNLKNDMLPPWAQLPPFNQNMPASMENFGPGTSDFDNFPPDENALHPDGMESFDPNLDGTLDPEAEGFAPNAERFESDIDCMPPPMPPVNDNIDFTEDSFDPVDTCATNDQFDPFREVNSEPINSPEDQNQVADKNFGDEILEPAPLQSNDTTTNDHLFRSDVKEVPDPPSRVNDEAGFQNQLNNKLPDKPPNKIPSLFDTPFIKPPSLMESTFDPPGSFNRAQDSLDNSGRPLNVPGGPDRPGNLFDRPGPFGNAAEPLNRPGISSGPFDKPAGIPSLFENSNVPFNRVPSLFDKPDGTFDGPGGSFDHPKGPFDRPNGPLERLGDNLNNFPRMDPKLGGGLLGDTPMSGHSGPYAVFDEPGGLAHGFEKPSGLLEPLGKVDSGPLPRLDIGSHINPVPEFCIGKQFNYNHGENKPQASAPEFLGPAKVIDYLHEKKPPPTEVQVDAMAIFDYGHGTLQPIVQNCVQDFKNWEESEQNLKEYHDEMRFRSERIGRVWTASPRALTTTFVPDELKGSATDVLFDTFEEEIDKDERQMEKDIDERRLELSIDERCTDQDKDERRERDKDDRISDRFRDKDRERERDRERDKDRDRDRNRDKDRDDRFSDRSKNDRTHSDRNRDKDRDDRHRNSGRDRDKSRDKDRDDRYKERDDRFKDRDDRHKDRDDRHKDREDRHKDRSHDKEKEDRYRDRDGKFKDRDAKESRSSEKDRDNRNQEKSRELSNKRDKSTADNESESAGVGKSSSPDGGIAQGELAMQHQESAKVDDSLPENEQNVLDNPPKILELPKTSNVTMVDDLLCPPARLTRPPKIAIILRGPPGSGKSFVAKLIKDKEVVEGGSAPRILSIDDYFLVEKDTPSGDSKKDNIDEMEYKYEESMESEYVSHLIKAFKKNVTDGFFNFIILDSINEKIVDYEEMWSFAKSKGFKVFICEMEMDVQICLKRNIHKRSEEEINRIVDYFEPAPSHHHKLDVSSLLQDEAIEDVEMEDVQEISQDADKTKEGEAAPSCNNIQENHENEGNSGISKWEKMEAEDKLDRLDGLKRKHDNKHQTMEEFLQVPDNYNTHDGSGKKHVRWADLEERKQQEKMRAVGFVVGQTNWNRMMDPTWGGSALTQTKYI